MYDAYYAIEPYNSKGLYSRKQGTLQYYIDEEKYIIYVLQQVRVVTCYHVILFNTWCIFVFSTTYLKLLFHRLQRQKKLFMTFKTGSPMVVTMDQQYRVEEKPTVIMYTYINRHAETPNETKQHTKRGGDTNNIQ